jgi:hypothetical protein
MPFSFRRFAPVLFVLCAGLLSAGCGSNNKGKIVGKWKATNLPGSDKDKEALKMAQDVALVLEFTADGKMTGTATVTVFGQTQTKEVMSADYKLGTGDWVFFTNVKPPPKNGGTKSKDKLVINGDTMTIDTESGEKITLTRMP